MGIEHGSPDLIGGRVPVDSSGTTTVVSGTVTANAGTNLNTSALALESTQVANGNLLGSITETAPITDTASSGLNGRLQRLAQIISSLIGIGGTPSANILTVQGSQTGTAQKTVPIAPYATDSYPNPIQAYPDPEAQQFGNDFPLNADVFGNLQTRGPVLTDEVSSRNTFSGSSLATTLTGNVKFASSSTQVDGVGTTFTTQVKSGSYIRRTAGTDAEYVQVDYVQDDTTLFLVSVYSGNFNNVPFQQTEYKPTIVGGASITIGSSLVNLVSSTASGNVAIIEKQGDYLPFNLQFLASISQRIANQTATIGFRDNATAPNIQAAVVFDGTTNTTVKFVTSGSSAAADTQTTTVTLPNGAVTSSLNTYQIDLVGPQACLLINGILVAKHETQIPGPYDNLKIVGTISNSALVTTTTLAIDYLYFSNQNRVNVGNDFQSDPIATMGFGLTASGSIKQLLIGQNGENLAADIGSQKTNYCSAIVGLVAANNPTDIFTLSGSATKTIKILRVKVSATKTTAGVADILFLKRSTANTGGTSTTPAAIPVDSNDAVATAISRAYTANSTVGTLTGNLDAQKYFLPTTSGAIGTFEYICQTNEKPITLRGINEIFAINLNGVTQSGNLFDISIKWSEE